MSTEQAENLDAILRQSAFPPGKRWVYVGTGDDHVLGFSAPAPRAAAVGKAVAFAPTGVRTSITRRVTA